MTAMDVGNLPPALVRSGGIVLWLETRLPDRSQIAQADRDHAEAAVLSVAERPLTRRSPIRRFWADLCLS